MNAQNVNWVTLTLSILGAVNLIGESYGYHLFNNTQMNAIGTLLSSILTVAGVFVSHTKPDNNPVVQNTSLKPPSQP